MTTHIQDAEIQKNILAELKWNPQVEEADIGVIVKVLRRHASLEANRGNVMVVDGAVTLSGSADSYFEKSLIEGAVWSAPGVTRVVDNLAIAPSYSEAA